MTRTDRRVNKKLIQAIIRELGIAGLPARRKGKPNLINRATTVELVNREFHRDGPNQLWMTDITEHPTREGKLYCCAVLNARPRKILGWKTPAEALDEHLRSVQSAGVASIE